MVMEGLYLAIPEEFKLGGSARVFRGGPVLGFDAFREQISRSLPIPFCESPFPGVEVRSGELFGSQASPFQAGHEFPDRQPTKEQAHDP